MSFGANAKGVFELRHNNVDGCCCGITSDQRFGEVGHHETKPDQTKQNLHM